MLRRVLALSPSIATAANCYIDDAPPAMHVTLILKLDKNCECPNKEEGGSSFEFGTKDLWCEPPVDRDPW